MSHVKTFVIMQLKSAFAYLPTSCTYAAGITCSLLVLCAVWKFYLHKKFPGFFGGGSWLVFSLLRICIAFCN